MEPIIAAATPTALAAGSIPNAHPLFVHFPIALLIAVLVLDLVVLFARKERLTVCTGALLLLAALGAAAALVTGFLAEGSAEAMPPDEARSETLEHHQTAAIAVLVLTIALAVWRAAARMEYPPGRLRWLYLALLAAACVLVSVAGHLGGALVYVHGVGVR